MFAFHFRLSITLHFFSLNLLGSETMAKDSNSSHNTSPNWWKWTPQVYSTIQDLKFRHKIYVIFEFLFILMSFSSLWWCTIFGHWDNDLNFFFLCELKLRIKISSVLTKSFWCRNPYSENPVTQPERTNEAAGAYAKACVAVAEECGIPVLDLWTKMQQFPDWENAYLRYCTVFFICMVSMFARASHSRWWLLD